MHTLTSSSPISSQEAAPDRGPDRSAGHGEALVQLRYPHRRFADDLHTRDLSLQSGLEPTRTTWRLLDHMREGKIAEDGAQYILRVLDQTPLSEILSHDPAYRCAIEVSLFHHLYVAPLQEVNQGISDPPMPTPSHSAAPSVSDLAAIVLHSPSRRGVHGIRVTHTDFLEKLLLNNDPLFSSRLADLAQIVDRGPDAPSLALWGTYQETLVTAAAQVRELLPCTASFRYRELLEREKGAG